ncbi:MAG: serine hydrolase domain-containing protein [Fibrobacterota bacterium]
MQIVYRIVLIISLLFLIPGCSEKTDTTDHVVREISAAADSICAAQNAPGAVAALRLPGGETVTITSGLADTGRKEKITETNYFRIGSTTKTITATAVLLLYQEGLISLDSTVSSFFPDLLPEAGDNITIRMLLNHSSGLHDYINAPYKESTFDTELIATPQRTWPPRELVRIAQNKGLAHTPGESFLYANTNYVILGMLIEKISGMSYEKYISDNILSPLGMHATIAESDSFASPLLTHGYFEKNGDSILFDYTDQSASAVWAAGSLVSTPEDLLIWIEALAEGTLLEDWVFKEQFNPIPTGYKDGTYGLGVEVRGEKRGHTGSVLGYQTQMYRRKNCDIIIYTNCYFQTKANVSEQIYNAVTEILDTWYD